MNKYVLSCVVNSESLLEAAKLLFKNKQYGHASSLAVLSIEECGKAFYMIFESDAKNVTKDFLKQIRSHKDKLEVASFEKFFTGLIKKGLFDEKNHPVKSIEEYQKKVKEYLKEGNKDFLELTRESLAYHFFLIIKECGFYVDIQNEKLITPQKVPKQIAFYVIEEAKKRLKEFLEEHKVV